MKAFSSTSSTYRPILLMASLAMGAISVLPGCELLEGIGGKASDSSDAGPPVPIVSDAYVYFFDKFDSMDGVSGIRFPNSIQRVRLDGTGALEELYNGESNNLENVHALGIDPVSDQLIVWADLPMGDSAILKGDREGKTALEMYFSFTGATPARVARAMAVSSDGYAYLATDINGRQYIERLSLNVTDGVEGGPALETLYEIVEDNNPFFKDRLIALNEVAGELFFMMSDANASSIYRGSMSADSADPYQQLPIGTATPNPINFFTGQFVYVSESQRLFFSNKEEPDGIYSIDSAGQALETIISNAGAEEDDPSFPALGVSTLGFDPISQRLVFAPDEGGFGDVAVFPLRTCTLDGKGIQDVMTSDGTPVVVQSATTLLVR